MKRLFKVSVVLTATLALMLCACTPSSSTGKADGTVRLERVQPEQVGMDSERLSKVDGIINASIEKKEIPGAVLAVVRDGKIYLATNPETQAPGIYIYDIASGSVTKGLSIQEGYSFRRLVPMEREKQAAL